MDHSDAETCPPSPTVDSGAPPGPLSAPTQLALDQCAKATRGAVLVQTEGANRGRRIALTPGEHTIGRATCHSIPVDPNVDRAVSSRHARLLSSGDAWWIEDLGSTNGTLVDGVPLQGGAHTLHPGARIEVGRSVGGDVAGTVAFTFELEGEVAQDGFRAVDAHHSASGSASAPYADVGMGVDVPPPPAMGVAPSPRRPRFADLRHAVEKGLGRIVSLPARIRIEGQIRDARERLAQLAPQAQPALGALGAALAIEAPDAVRRTPQAGELQRCCDEAATRRVAQDQLTRDRAEIAEKHAEEMAGHELAINEAEAVAEVARRAFAAARTEASRDEQAVRTYLREVQPAFDAAAAGLREAAAVAGGAPIPDDLNQRLAALNAHLSVCEPAARRLGEALVVPEAARLASRRTADTAAAALHGAEQRVRERRDLASATRARHDASIQALETRETAARQALDAMASRTAEVHAELGRTVFRQRIAAALGLPAFEGARAAHAALVEQEDLIDKLTAELRAHGG